MENNNISKEYLMNMVSKHEMWYISHRLGSYDDDGNMKIQGVTIEESDDVFKNATLHRSEFVNCIFNNISIIYCGLRCARFINCTFNNCYISCSDITDSKFIKCDFNNVEFNKCSMDSSVFDDCYFTKSKIDNYYSFTIVDYDGDFTYAFSCPTEGSFIGWKKAKLKYQFYIVKLLIPEDAKRLSGTGHKCRCDKAVVLDIQDLNGNSVSDCIKTVYSRFNSLFKYRVGSTVIADDFDENRFNECSYGIHFFIDRQEAVDYKFT